MDKAIANRMWAHFLGYGFTKPVDDMGPHNPPTASELLDYLGKKFRKNSFNLKELIRWITLSEAYSLSSKVQPSNKADDPLLGETPKFTHFYLRQMRAEELYESLLVATQAHKTSGSYEEQEKIKARMAAAVRDRLWHRRRRRSDDVQRHHSAGLDDVQRRPDQEGHQHRKGSFLGKIASSSLKPADKIDYLFQAGTVRASRPVAKSTVANKLMDARKGDSVGALQDMWWAVLNSNEFIMHPLAW